MASTTFATTDRIALDDAVHGTVVWPNDPGFADARSVWNGMIDREPAVIVQCVDAADVRRAIAFARDNDLPLSVRGGGHNVAGTAVRDDALVVDLSRMTAVRVDPAKRVAWVAGGATWADVDHATQAFGLATPGGVVSETGVGGLTLGGGIGHLRRQHGLACDNLRAIDLVTADGDLVHATDETHPELTWACRGGGVAPGVVTGFEFDLHPVGPEVATVFVLYHARDATAVMRGYREWAATAPRAASTLTSAGVMPDPDVFEPDVVDEPKIGIFGCHAGDPDVGVDELRPLRELADPLVDFSEVAPYAAFQQILDDDYPDGMRYYWKSLYLDGLPDAAIDRLLAWAERAPSDLSTVDVWQLDGAIADGDRGAHSDSHVDASAFPARDAPFLLGVEANWEAPVMDDANVAWVRECLADVREFSDGSVYLNFPGFFEDADEAMRTAFGDDLDRLRDVQRTYDPDGIFASDRGVAARPE